MRGRDLDEARGKVAGKFDGDELERQARHRVFPGNRPSTTLVYPKLDPETLGRIVALYEHRVFVEGPLVFSIAVAVERVVALALQLAG